MTKYIIFAGSDDGYIDSNSTTYSTARAGTGTKTATNGTSTALVGQSKVSTTYHCYETFLGFDTSAIPTTDIIGSADLLLNISSVTGWTYSGNHAYAYIKNWTTPVDVTDWIAGASLQTTTNTQPGILETLSASQKVHIPLLVGKSGTITAGGSTRMLLATQHLDNGTAPTGNEYFAIYTQESGTTAPALVVQTYKPSYAVGVGQAITQISTGQTVECKGTGSPSSLQPSVVYYDKFTTTSHTIYAGGSALSFGLLDPNAFCTPELVGIAVDSFDNIYIVGPFIDSNGNQSMGIYFLASGGVGSLTWSTPVLKGVIDIDQSELASVACCMFPGKNTTTPPGAVLPANTDIKDEIAIEFITRGQSSASTINSRMRAVVISTYLLHNNVAVGATNPSRVTIIAADTGLNSTRMFTADTFQGNPHIALMGFPDRKYLYGHAIMYETGAGGKTAVFVNMMNPAPYPTGYNYAFQGVSDGSGSGVGSIVSSGATAPTADTKIELVYTGSDLYAMCPLEPGNPGLIRFAISSLSIADFDLTSGLTNLIDASSNGAWNLFYDPNTNTIWYYALSSVTAGEIDKVPFRCATKTWDDAHATTATAGAPTTGSNVYLKMTDSVCDERSAHLVLLNNNAGALSQYVYCDTSYNVAPNAPVVAPVATFDKSFAKTVTWTPSDNNKRDTQAKYEIEIDNNSTLAAAWRPGVITSAATSSTIPANTLAQNTTFRMRIRTYDEQNTTGAWSAYTIFSTSDVGSVTITNPVDDLQTGNSSSVTLGISYVTSGASTISKYRIKVVRVSDSVVISDTGDTSVGGTPLTLSIPVTNLPSDIPLRFDVYIINSATQTTATASRLYTTSYAAPDQIVDLTANPNGSQINLQWTVPVPTGSRSTPETIAIYRADSSTDLYQLIGRVVGTSQSFTDYIPKANSSPSYYVVSELSTGSTNSNVANAGTFAFFGIAVNKCNNNSNSPWDPAIMMFYGGSSTSEKRTDAATKLQFQGRPTSVTAFGDNQEHTVSAKAVVPFQGNPVNDIDDVNMQDMYTILNALDTIVENHDLVCFRDGRGRKIFCNVGDYDASDSEVGSDVTLDLAATDYQESNF